MNKVILIGNLGTAPETKYTDKELAISKFSLGTNEFSKGEKKTEWHKVVAFGKTAEICQKYATKGSKLGVEGRITTEKWQNKEGNDMYTTKIIADRVELLSPKGSGGGGGESKTDQGDIPF